ncbi:MAG: hypothetical protein RR161_00900 [Bacilli bacterium]
MNMSQLKYKLYFLKFNLLFNYGVKSGKILPYEDKLIERLRDVYYGGLPASILLFINQMCNGKCYDRSMLITTSMDDFQLVNGDIKDLELRFGKESVDHSWAESNGWVYDTSLGLKIEKKLYNAIHEPQTNKINSKEACYAYQEYQEILNSDLEKDKYMLLLILPLIEPIADKEIFSDFVKSEIARFKEQINYDALCKEIGEDMIAKGFSKKKNTSVRQT